jgi:hypothetical protein
MDKLKLSPGNIVILAGGLVMLVGSFLDFYEASDPDTVLVLGRSLSWSAWASEDGLLLFPLTTFIVLFGVAMAAHVAVTTFASVDLPDRVLGFTWDQIHLVLGFQATIMMLAYLIRSKGGLDWGIGFWLMLLSAIALLVGAILRARDAESATTPPAW